MRRRWWLFRPLDLIARHWPVFKPRHGVLAVRMDGIGDMVLFRGALDHYAETFGVAPEDITVLGCDSWSSIADEVFAGYRVHTIDEHAYARRPLYRFVVSMWVRRLAPRVVVSDSYFRRSLMADSLAWVAGAPETLVSRPYINEPIRPEFTYYLSQADRVIDTGDYPTHEVTRHFRFVSAVSGRDAVPGAPRIPWRDQPPPIEDGAPYVILSPGSNEPGRRWPFAGYVGVARKLLAKGYRVVFVGTKGERPNRDTGQDPARALAGKDGVIDLTGETSLPALLDLMRHARAVLSNDSGPAHLSIALGTPTVVVVGGGHFGCFFPYPDGVAPPNARFAYQRMDCYHCFWRCLKRETKYDVFPCISAVGEDEVWRHLEDLLAEGAVTEGAD